MIVSKRLVEDDENVLARKVFVTLVKLYPRGYSILNDGNFVKYIYAASDEEAIRQFNELATKGKLLTESVKKAVKEQIVEAKHKTLVESVMSDLDLEVKEAGGKEAWIANIDEQIDDLSHYLNYLKKSAYNEVNRGGNFESANEVDDAIRDCEKQLGLLKSKKQLVEERKDKSINEALYGMNQIEQFVKMANAIGLKTMGDVKDFLEKAGDDKDILTALYDYLHNEIGDLDFHAKDESLKENLDLDNIEFDNPGQAVRAGLDAVYKLIKSPNNASIRFFISSMASKYKMTDLELDYLEDFISNVLEGMNEHSMAMKYRNGKLPIRYAENLTDADNAYVERMFDECKTVSDLQDLLFEAINNLSLELGESLKEDLAVAVNGEEVPVDAEKQPIEEIQEKISIEQVLSDLIKDEFEAIDGYNSSIATLKILEDDGSDYSGIIANLEDIKNEELIHVGQLQKCLAEVNPEAEAIDDGNKEASETIAAAEEESAKGEEPVVEA